MSVRFMGAYSKHDPRRWAQIVQIVRLRLRDCDFAYAQNVMFLLGTNTARLARATLFSLLFAGCGRRGGEAPRRGPTDAAGDGRVGASPPRAVHRAPAFPEPDVDALPVAADIPPDRRAI